MKKLSHIAKQTPQGILTLTDQVKDIVKPEKVTIAAKKKSIAHLSVFCFRKACLYDPFEWKYHYYLAKSYSKSESDPNLVVQSCLDAITVSLLNFTEFTDSVEHSKDQVLPPLVKLVTFLTKSLYWGRMDPSIVMNSISTIVNPVFAKWSITAISSKSFVNENSHPQNGTTRDTCRLSAFDMLIMTLEQLKMVDVHGLYPSLVFYVSINLCIKIMVF